ncbi:unnamed protein product [Absidia cylindrospora]
MTNDEQVESLVKDLSLKDSHQQQQKESFQVVLVDIEKTSENKVIHCVKKPLEESDLKFVALSYRWGELHEILVDTKVGYTASITSFDLDDFYQLCYMMTLESDLKDIKYVWVDAICVDQRPSKRKATIYQMSNIYHKATYILAVPDLHLAYLRRISIKNDDAIEGSNKHSKYIYHLLHQNTNEFAAVEEDFLNDANVPKDPPALRELLLKYTEYFSVGFTQYRDHNYGYCPVRALDHICETNKVHKHHRHHHRKDWIKGSKNTLNDLHKCNEAICPLSLIDRRDIFLELDEIEQFKDQITQFLEPNWKSKVIERNTAIRQSIEFLTDLIKDWSSRVWVISEFNIAKKKNNLKAWFIQLAPTDEDSSVFRGLNNEFTFFKFGFDDHSYPDEAMLAFYNQTQHESRIDRLHSSNPVYDRFHYTLIRHLHQQTFVEMILKSKASRNEDRFYSILPLSEYADQITEVSHWDIHSMLSVKLKLYEMMNTRDKLNLLFWSSNKNAIINGILPTFATSTLPLDFNVTELDTCMVIKKCNFDLWDPSSIMLHHQTDHKTKDEDDNANRYYLRLKPMEYYVIDDHTFFESHMGSLTQHIQVLKQLDVHHVSSATLDIVSIPAFQHNKTPPPLSEIRYIHEFYFCILVGSFAQNKWTILTKHCQTSPDCKTCRLMCHNGDEDPKPVAFFDIY